MEKSLQMINVIKHLIRCLFNLTGISHSSYFLVKIKTSWRTSQYKPISMWIYYVVMNRNFWNLWNAYFLVSSFSYWRNILLKKNINTLMKEIRLNTLLWKRFYVMKNIFWLFDICIHFYTYNFLDHFLMINTNENGK